MTDQYEELIKNLKLLKENQIRKETKVKEIASSYTVKKNEINSHFSKISTLLKELETEVEAIENKKTELIDAFSFDKKDDNIDQNLPYKKFYVRESLFTKLLRKTNYQTIYNMTLSFLILNGLIYLLNIYNGISRNPFSSSNFSVYIKGFFEFVQYFIVKNVMSFLLIFLMNILPRSIIVYLIPNGMIGIIVMVLFNEKVFATKNFSSIIKGLHYWDNITFILKLFSYYCEKKLYVTYLAYNSYHNINQGNPNYSLSIQIKDAGDSDIIFEFTKFNNIKEAKHYFRFYLLPTFIYRDEYPKPKTSSHILSHLMNCILCFIFLYIGVEVGLIPLLKAKLTEISFINLANLFVSFTLFCVCGLFVIIFGCSHSYSNFTSSLLRFGDKHFYDDFYNAKDPKTFIEKVSYIYCDFCKYYICPIAKQIFIKNGTDLSKSIVDNLITIGFLCLIVDYIVYSCIHTNSPIISMCLTITFFASFPMKLIKGDGGLVVNWLFLTSGMGFIGLILGSEIYLDNIGVKFDKLSFIEQHIPKIYNLFMHPDKMVK